ncbi:MAG: penicillin-binding protein 1A [Clostridiaceae bacterium]|nr:penicillin-binding protein 1A [Clostridiaceae bacterium]
MNKNFGSRKEADVSAAASKKNTSIGLIILALFFKALLISLAIVFSVLLVAGSAAGGLLGGGVYGIIKTTPMVEAELFKTMGFNSYVYDADGNVIAELKREENRVWINYEDIPDMLIDAYIAVEDKRFKDHKGIDFRRIGSAVLTYGRKLLGADVDIEGGSTITQQLIKNLTKQDDITIPRKLQEQWQAMELEKVLTKEEILTYYLNNIPMGGNFYGIETAAKGYFGKDVRDLSLAECASLAGITNWPTKYMPINEDNIEANLARTKTTLGLMLEQGKITQSEYDEALSEKIAFHYNPEAGKVMKTSNQSYFVDEVIKSLKQYLMQTSGYTEQAALDIIYNNGLHIYSSMDPKIQKALDEVFSNPEFFSFDNKLTDEMPQAAMAILGKDGFVKGVYGGRGAKEGSVFNRATQAERPPGSAIKPILIYGPGIDSKAITAATVVDDVKQYLLHDKPEQEWPRNVEKANYGLTTARIGVFKSRNVVATLLLKDYVGLPTALDYLNKLGIDRQNEQYLSIAMGGFNKGMTPLEMAAAFTPFANKGVYTKPMFFTEVKDNSGKTIISVKPERNQVFSEQTVFIMDDIMQDVVKMGTAYPEGIIEYKDAEDKKVVIPSAGKTGTTDSDKDKWFCGFTPYYVGVSWYGYDKAVEIQKEEKDNALLIWNAVMNKIHEGLPSVPFFESTPPNIVKRTICIDSGKIATDLCRKDPRGGRVREEYFIEGTEPAYSDTCKVHVSYEACTASQDAQKRDLLATEYCPFETIVLKVGLKRPVEYKPAFPNDPYPADSIYEIPEGEFCTVHEQSILIPPIVEEYYPPESTIEDGTLPEGYPGGPSAEDIGDPIEEENYEDTDWDEGNKNYD